MMNRLVLLLSLFLALAIWSSPAAAQSPKALSEAVAEDSPVKNYPFRGSTLAWYQNLNVVSLDRGSELTWNPSYSWLFRLQPRYHFTDKLSLRLKLDLAVELTNADDTKYYREPQWGDTWLDTVYGPAFTIPGLGAAVTPSLRLIFPTSKASRARSLYLGVSPGFALSRSFKLGAMSLDLSYSFRYTKNLNQYTTVQYESPTIANCSAAGGDCGQFLHTGSRNPSQDFWNIFLVDWGITKKLKFSLMVAFYNALLYDLTAAQAPLAGGGKIPVGTDGNNVSHRAAIWYLGEFSYEIHPTLTLGLGFSTFNPQLAEDSTYRPPFFNRYTEIMLTTTLAIDHIVAAFDRRLGK
jgi:hypothetical protein